MSAGVETIERSNFNNIPIEEEMFLNQTNIKELLESDWSPELQVIFIFCFLNFCFPILQDTSAIYFFILNCRNTFLS